jgi:hypothetical protein
MAPGNRRYRIRPGGQVDVALDRAVEGAYRVPRQEQNGQVRRLKEQCELSIAGAE